MKKFILILLAAASILGGCAKYKQIAIDDVNLGKVRMVALNAAEVDINLKVNNPTKAALELDGVDLVIYNENSEFAKITQVKKEAVLVTSGNSVPVKITLRAELTNPFAALAQGLDPKSWDLEKFKANGTITIRKGKIYKKLEIEDIPLSAFAPLLDL